MTKEFFTDKELAERWGLKLVTLQTWRQKGKPPSFTRFGSAVRYSKEAVELFENDNVCSST
ncbi:MAG: helix-turn-helix domain-containing protein [Methylococcales bacterium]|jgi:predicted site-specific integrase-resolvase|nr:helix-turn-helix domain-containing protein [Methylococcales bacterium]